MTCASEPYSGEQCYKAHGAAWAWYVGEDQRAVPELEQQETTRDRMILRQYILHLTDIIDRMETALENVIGERDYLAERLREADPDLCGVCVYAAQPPDAPECEQCSNREPDNFHFAGVPMDWDADAHPADH